MNYLIQSKDYLVKGMQIIEFGTGIANTLGFSNSIPKSFDSPLNKNIHLDPLLTIFSLGALYLSPEGSKIRIEKSHIEIDVNGWMQSTSRPSGCIHHLRDIFKGVHRFCETQKTDENSKIAATVACKALRSLRRVYAEKIQIVSETEAQTYRKYCKKITKAIDRLQLFIQPKTTDDIEKSDEKQIILEEKENRIVENITAPSSGPVLCVENLIEKYEIELIVKNLKDGMKQKKKFKRYIETGQNLKKILDIINTRYDNLVNK